jgi:hypothetical protein
MLPSVAGATGVTSPDIQEMLPGAGSAGAFEAFGPFGGAGGASGGAGLLDLASMLPAGGVDALDLSDGFEGGFIYQRAQFEVSFRVMQATSGAQGTEFRGLSFSMKASMEVLQVWEGGTAEEAGVSPLSSEALWEKLMDFVSPEKTAGRILDFALHFFPRSEAFAEGGDTADARGRFADVIGPAIQKGFDEALGTLGTLPETVQEDVDETHRIVFEGLDNFVQNGLDRAKTAGGGLYERIAEWRLQAEARELLAGWTPPAAYGADGRAVSPGEAAPAEDGAGTPLSLTA